MCVVANCSGSSVGYSRAMVDGRDFNAVLGAYEKIGLPPLHISCREFEEAICNGTGNLDSKFFFHLGSTKFELLYGMLFLLRMLFS